MKRKTTHRSVEPGTQLEPVFDITTLPVGFSGFAGTVVASSKLAAFYRQDDPKRKFSTWRDFRTYLIISGYRYLNLYGSTTIYRIKG